MAMTHPPNSMDGRSGNPEALTTVYQELCRTHDAIADFRAKLLALLPIASGAGLVVLLPRDDLDGAEPQLLVAIGAVGALLGIGLYLHELRGIHKCAALSCCAAVLETRLLGTEEKIGAFSGRPRGFGAVGPVSAALVIYPTLIASWSLVALLGSSGMLSSESGATLCLFAAAAAIGAGAVIAGYLFVSRVKSKVKDDYPACSSFSVL